MELVYKDIKSGRPLEQYNGHSYLNNEVSKEQNVQSTVQDNFFESIYNWQDSNNAIFKEEKKEKKKMLSV